MASAKTIDRYSRTSEPSSVLVVLAALVGAVRHATQLHDGTFPAGRSSEISPAAIFDAMTRRERASRNVRTLEW